MQQAPYLFAGDVGKLELAQDVSGPPNLSARHGGPWYVFELSSWKVRGR